MPTDINFCNGSGGATKWHKTIQNMSFRTKVVDWACLLQKTRNRSRGIKSCIKCTSVPVFATCQVWLQNGMEPPTTRVLDIKDVVRNQIDILEHRNGVKIPKILVLDLNEWIEIFHVVCLESYSETFNQMHHDTSFHNGSGASTKWRETTQNMNFGPKVVDWACSLLENKKRFRWHKLVH
jgi:hypothetical protein